MICKWKVLLMLFELPEFSTASKLMSIFL